MSPLRSPLFWRLLAGFLAVNLLVLLLGGFLARRFIEYSTAVEIDWPALAQQANRAYDDGGDAGLAAWSAQQRHEGVDATLYQDGHALQRVHLPPPVRESLPAWLAVGRDVLVQPWSGAYVVVQQVMGAHGERRQFVAFSRMHTRVPYQSREKILLAVQGVLSLLLIALAGWWVARSVARPVEVLRDAAQRMTAGELSVRIDSRWESSRDELGQLARDFNAMAARIELLVAHDRGVLQDLSHEVRSPLARLQLILDLARHSASPQQAAEHFRQAEREIDRLDRMVGEMLALSRLQGDLPGMENERVDLAWLARERVEIARLEADARHVRLQLQAASPAIVSGNEMLLRRALDNLIANAVKFSPEGGLVNVSVSASANDAEVRVSDNGPGVPEQELDSLFRPFFRGSNAARAEGHGLGLSIVRSIVLAHRGDISACNRVGGGLCVCMRFPSVAEKTIESDPGFAI